MSKRTDFVYSDKQEPHRLRTKKILQQHPEVRQLIGKNKYTFFAILGLVLFQCVMAWLLKDSSWWMIIGAAYLLGAFADHSLFVMIHECAHHLLFKRRAANRLSGILANLPQLFPSSVSFERYHIKHHSFQGVHELDADLPNRWEARLISNFFIGKCIWLLFYPLFQIFRISRLREIKPFDKWVALNFAAEAIFIAAIWYFLGPKAIVYLLLSFFFSVGLHPLGARWIQEHYLTHDEQQETFSYYGVLNLVAFNVGHHNEHHDFPSIPWNKLPKIRKAAPEYYDTLFYHKSWTLLFFRFLFDSEISLWSRIVRKERGKVSLNDQSTPDRDLVSASSKASAMTRTIVCLLTCMTLLTSFNLKTQKVIFFGDSITYMGARPGGYIVRMKDALEKKNLGSDYDLIGAGIGGNKVYDLYLRMDDDVLQQNPDIVFIWIGVNDVWHKTLSATGTDADKFEKFYTAIINKCLDRHIRLFLVTPAVIGEKTDYTNQQDGDLNAYSQIIRNLAQKFHTGLVDLRENFHTYELKSNPGNKESGILTVDRVHLNDAGNQLVADNMLDALLAK